MPKIIPEVRITGKKKILLAIPRPLNFWFKRFAAKKLKIRMSGTWMHISFTALSSFKLKSGSIVSARL